MFAFAVTLTQNLSPTTQSGGGGGSLVLLAIFCMAIPIIFVIVAGSIMTGPPRR